jgi:hypothetical protein
MMSVKVQGLRFDEKKTCWDWTYFIELYQYLPESVDLDIFENDDALPLPHVPELPTRI